MAGKISILFHCLGMVLLLFPVSLFFHVMVPLQVLEASFVQRYVQSNLNGWNTFGTMKISSRQG